jgi:hypothetical protein
MVHIMRDNGTGPLCTWENRTPSRWSELGVQMLLAPGETHVVVRHEGW